MEGVGCALAGMWGSGPGSTSYSENIGIVGATKVNSSPTAEPSAHLKIKLNKCEIT